MAILGLKQAFWGYTEGVKKPEIGVAMLVHLPLDGSNVTAKKTCFYKISFFLRFFEKLASFGRWEALIRFLRGFRAKPPT